MNEILQLAFDKYTVYYNHYEDALYIYFADKPNSGFNDTITKDIVGIYNLKKDLYKSINGIMIRDFSNKTFIPNKHGIRGLVAFANELIKNNTIRKLLVFK